jgi:hypothetical protein
MLLKDCLLKRTYSCREGSAVEVELLNHVEALGRIGEDFGNQCRVEERVEAIVFATLFAADDDRFRIRVSAERS